MGLSLKEYKYCSMDVNIFLMNLLMEISELSIIPWKNHGTIERYEREYIHHSH
jgi:hypothetical protein